MRPDSTWFRQCSSRSYFWDPTCTLCSLPETLETSVWNIIDWYFRASLFQKEPLESNRRFGSHRLSEIIWRDPSSRDTDEIILQLKCTQKRKRFILEYLWMKKYGYLRFALKLSKLRGQKRWRYGLVIVPVLLIGGYMYVYYTICMKLCNIYYIYEHLHNKKLL